MRNSKIAIFVAFISIIGFFGVLAPEAKAQKELDSKDKLKIAMEKCTNLTRLDFELRGSNCSACLGRIKRRMLKEPGVFDAAVCIQKPYGATVLFDGSKNKAEAIMTNGIKGEKKVKALNLTVQKLKKPPFVLVPHISPMNKDK